MVSLKLSQGRKHQSRLKFLISAEIQSFKSHNTSRSSICFRKKMQGTNIFRKVVILARSTDSHKFFSSSTVREAVELNIFKSTGPGTAQSTITEKYFFSFGGHVNLHGGHKYLKKVNQLFFSAEKI